MLWDTRKAELAAVRFALCVQPVRGLHLALSPSAPHVQLHVRAEHLNALKTGQTA